MIFFFFFWVISHPQKSPPLRLCLVGVILGRMENEGEKSGEKMMFLVVWLRVEKRRDFGGTHQFSLLPSKTQSLQIGEKMRVKVGQKYLDKIAHIFFLLLLFFFFWATSTWRNKCGLPTIFFFSFFSFGFHSFTGRWFFFLIFFLYINMMMCISAWTRDSP